MNQEDSVNAGGLLSQQGPALTPAPWGIRQVLLLLFLAGMAFVLVVLTVLLAAKLLTILGHPRPVLEVELAATLVFELCLLALALAFSIGRGGMTFNGYGFRRFPLQEIYLSAIGISGTFVILAIYIGAVSVLHLPRLAPTPNLPKGIFQAKGLAIPAAIMACLVAPIVEESFFRGFIFRGLLGRTLKIGRTAWRFSLQLRIGFVGAALTSGFLFAAFHGELGLLLPFTFVGALFAWIFWRSGSLWPNILAHAGFNIVSFTLAIATRHS